MSKVPEFKPVPVRPRHDGWTAERQIRFIEALADTGCVAAACRQVGMSRNSAYELYRRPFATEFRAAWDAATDCGTKQLEEAFIERSKNGVPRPIFYKGEQVGEWRQFDERATMFLLRHRRPDRYGKWIERASAPPPMPTLESLYEAGSEVRVPDDHELHPAVRLNAHLDAIESTAPIEHGNPVDWEEPSAENRRPGPGDASGPGDDQRRDAA